jgi:phosphoglycerate dehydrogenase-like enzyme
MEIFRINMTGDLLDMNGNADREGLGLNELDQIPYIKYDFMRDLAPSHDDPTYYDRYYSLLIEPRHIADVHSLYVVRPWIKPSTFADGAENLTVIARAGAGYDKIDVQACTDNDVALFNAPDALTHGTASAALTLMLALAKRLPQQEMAARTGRWDLQGSIRGQDIEYKTLGIVGMGRSGRELARLIAPFEMKILAYSPHADPAEVEKLGIKLVSLDELFRESDYVSLHPSLRPDTRGMIRREHLFSMKPTAFFINVARGELVDEEALIDLLRERRIAGAGLDVFEEEPLPVESPLIKMDNVILTPHWLPATIDGGRKISASAMGGLKKAARGEVPENVINREVLDKPGFKAKLARFEANR